MLNSHEAHIWSLSLSLSESQENVLFEKLSSEEKQRALKFRFKEHKTHFIAAHAALRSILAQYTGSNPETIKFSYNAFKKPFIENTKDLQFNLSHSGSHALIAIAKDHPIGIDIEKIKEKDYSDLAVRFFHPEEIKRLNALSPTEKMLGFYQLWTRKEALIKAVGKGLHIPLNHFIVYAKNIIETISYDDMPLTLYPLATPLSYIGTLASAATLQHISYQHYHFP